MALHRARRKARSVVWCCTGFGWCSTGSTFLRPRRREGGESLTRRPSEPLRHRNALGFRRGLHFVVKRVRQRDRGAGQVRRHPHSPLDGVRPGPEAGASRIVTIGFCPGARFTHTRPASASAPSARDALVRWKPNAWATAVRETLTVRDLARPARNHIASPTCRALPGREPAAMTHGHGIGPLRNASASLALARTYAGPAGSRMARSAIGCSRGGWGWS